MPVCFWKELVGDAGVSGGHWSFVGSFLGSYGGCPEVTHAEESWNRQGSKLHTRSCLLGTECARHFWAWQS